MKKLPKTIKMKRALAGEPRNYSKEQLKEIIKEIGSLPAGRVVYQGDFAAFHILGEEIPELKGMWHQYMHDGPLQKKQMTRELALRLHLEGAAYRYKKDRKSEGSTLSQEKKYLKALHVYADAIEQFEKKQLKGEKDLSQDRGRLRKLKTGLDEATSEYKNDEPLKERTPTQNKTYLSKLKNACDILIEELDTFKSRSNKLQDRINPLIPRLREDAYRALIPMRKEILRQQEICSGQKIPRAKRHQEDVALQGLISSLCEVWGYILEKKVSPGRVSADGKSGGPLIRFIQSAIIPLGIVDKTPAAIRKTLRNEVAKSENLMI